MPKLPNKKPPAKVGKLDVPKAIKSVVYEKVPEATLAETGMAMILAGLGEQKVMTIPDIVAFPDMLAEAGLPTKLAPWIVKLAIRLDRDARDAMMWRVKDRPLFVPGPEKSWPEIKKLERGETITQAPRAVALPTAPPITKQTPKPTATSPQAFSIFD